MRDMPEEEGEAWELPQEMSPHLEGHKWSLFFRLARKRADYFSDIEDLLLAPEIDVFPTRHSSAFRRAIESILTQPDNLLSFTEQPTRLSLIVEAPTLLLPHVVALPAGIAVTPMTLKLLARDMAGEGRAARSENLMRRAWQCGLALRSAGRSWLAHWRLKSERSEPLSSSWQSVGE